MGAKHNKCCCPVLCDLVTELWDTGEEYTGTNIEGFSDPYGPCAIDDHWTANGGPAYVFKIYQTSLSPAPDDRTESLGCAFLEPDLLAITSVCSVTSGGAPLSNQGKAVVEPGGPDGAEVVFECDFEIPVGTDLDRIAFCGRIAFDNYIPVGQWKVNGIDQVHLEHGTYEDAEFGPGRLCAFYGFTKESAGLVHGTNHIAITVKNGNLYSDPLMFGGPLFLQMSINCVERSRCNLNSTGWYVRVGDEIGVGDEWNWARLDENEDPYDCACYCVEGGPPTSEMLYPGQTEEVPCKEAHEYIDLGSYFLGPPDGPVTSPFNFLFGEGS